MKDTDKVELTVGSVKKAAESCGTAKEVLKTLFPEVFRDEWDDVTRDLYFVPDKAGWPWVLCGPEKVGAANFFQMNENFKVSNGRIWRRKS